MTLFLYGPMSNSYSAGEKWARLAQRFKSDHLSRERLDLKEGLKAGFCNIHDSALRDLLIVSLLLLLPSPKLT